jgi:hypothetical protein
VTLVPYRDRINFVVRVGFAGVKPARNWLDVDLWLTRRIESPRLRKVESLTPYTHIHTVRVTDSAGVDDELAGCSAPPTNLPEVLFEGGWKLST